MDDGLVNAKFFVIFFIGLVAGYFVSGGGIVSDEPSETNGPESKNLEKEVTGGLPEECADVSEVKKDMCVANYAIKKDDVSYCDSVKSSGARNYCIGFIEKDAERCESVEDDFLKERCMSSVEGEAQVQSYSYLPKPCKGINDSKKDMCIARNAINNSNVSLCEEPTSEDVRNYCYGMTSFNSSRCESIDDEFLRENCMNVVGG